MSSVRLSLWNLLSVHDEKNVPEKRLPPSFGTMFMRTPPGDTSAPAPLVWYDISSIIAWLKYCCTAPSPSRPFTIRPSTWTVVCEALIPCADM